ADPTFAARIAANERITMAELDRRFHQVLEARGRTRTPQQRAERGKVIDQVSGLIHARHRGLQFMVEVSAIGTLIRRDPPARHIPDRGRLLALSVLSVAAEA